MENSQRINLPYCIQRQTSGKYVLLNRNYKPVGNATREWVDYETLDGLDLRLTEADAQQISWSGNNNIRHVYLFNDGCAPWAGKRHRVEYVRRLAVLEGIAAIRCGFLAPVDIFIDQVCRTKA